MRLKLVHSLAAALIATQALAETSVAPDGMSFAMEAGEAQSAVVRPGAKSQCQSGRVIVTNDWVRPATADGVDTAGVAEWRDLAGGTQGKSVFNAPPNAADYAYGSNDHSIVALANGDLVYQIGAFSKRPIGGPVAGAISRGRFQLPAVLIKKPDWFDATYRNGFGPGARTTLMTWRSEDCGATFKFISEIDSWGLAREDCALPQPLAGPPNPATQKWDMGGTDGPWLGVDHATGDLLATQGCVGNFSKPGVAGYELDPGNKIRKTYVFASSDRGDSWRTLGAYQDPASWGWRVSGVARPGKGYAFGFGTAAVLGATNQTGKIKSFAIKDAPAGAPWGWDAKWFKGNARICASMWASTAIARVPSSGHMIFAYPASLKPPAMGVRVGEISGPMVEAPAGTFQLPKGIDIAPIPGPGKAPAEIKPALTHGYRLLVYNPETDEVADLPPVLPAGRTVDHAIMHLTFVDPGEGPVLAYWYDLDLAAETAVIRGRMIFGPDSLSKDFDISRAGGARRAFSLARTDGGPSICPTPGSYWFGDYKSAGAFKAPRPARAASLAKVSAQYRYFPIWIEPDKTVRYTEVSYAAPMLNTKAPPLTIEEVKLELEWKKPGPPEEFRLPEIEGDFRRK